MLAKTPLRCIICGPWRLWVDYIFKFQVSTCLWFFYFLEICSNGLVPLLAFTFVFLYFKPFQLQLSSDQVANSWGIYSVKKKNRWNRKTMKQFTNFNWYPFNLFLFCCVSVCVCVCVCFPVIVAHLFLLNSQQCVGIVSCVHSVSVIQVFGWKYFQFGVSAIWQLSYSKYLS